MTEWSERRLFIHHTPCFITNNAILKPQVRLPKDADTGRPRGFGYVAFVNEADVQRAIDEMNGLEVLTRPIRIEKMKPKEDSFNRG